LYGVKEGCKGEQERGEQEKICDVREDGKAKSRMQGEVSGERS
jgi:hypothetical protein